MEKQRHKGFVARGDQSHSSGKTVWKVRVKDAESSFDGQLIIVASTHGGIELGRGLNVDFAIGTVDDETGNKVPRAVDVCLESPDAKPESESQTSQQVRRGQ